MSHSILNIGYVAKKMNDATMPTIGRGSKAHTNSMRLTKRRMKEAKRHKTEYRRSVRQPVPISLSSVGETCVVDSVGEGPELLDSSFCPNLLKLIFNDKDIALRLPAAPEIMPRYAAAFAIINSL
jgi:hypothetical protein